MANDLNKVILIGNITKDAVMGSTSNAKVKSEFSIAVNKQGKDANGNKTEYVSYFFITLWGKAAESLTQYLTKGKKVCIEGSLRQDRWEDQNGNKQSKISIITENVYFLSSGGKSGQSAEGFVPVEENADGFVPSGEFPENLPL